MIKERRTGSLFGLDNLDKIVTTLAQKTPVINQEGFKFRYDLLLETLIEDFETNAPSIIVTSKSFNTPELLLNQLIKDRQNYDVFALPDHYDFSIYHLNIPLSKYHVTRLKTERNSKGLYQNHVLNQQITHFS